MATFTELADRLKPFTRASVPPQQVRAVLPDFERAALELWNGHVSNTPGFLLRFEEWHAVALYLAQTFPDAVWPPEFWGPEDNLLAKVYVDCFRLLAGWAGETELSEVQQWILKVLDLEGRLCVYASREDNDLRRAIIRHLNRTVDATRLREDFNKLAARGLVKRDLGPKRGGDITEAGREYLASLSTS